MNWPVQKRGHLCSGLDGEAVIAMGFVGVDRQSVPGDLVFARRGDGDRHVQLIRVAGHGLPSFTVFPALSITFTVQNGISRSSVKLRVRALGALATTAPTGGTALCRKAWAKAGEMPASVKE
jgi:hypothetical protein